MLTILLFQVFKGYGPLVQPGISPLLVIITNTGIYAIRHSDSKIKPKFSCNFHQLNAILVIQIKILLIHKLIEYSTVWSWRSDGDVCF